MKQVEAISAIFIQGDIEILLLHRTPGRTYNPDRWDLMGGDILPGESPTDTFCRDAVEKLNLRRGNVASLLSEPLRVREADADVLRHIFVISGADYSNIRLDPTKYDEFRWVGPGEIKPLKLATGVEPVLEAFGFLMY